MTPLRIWLRGLTPLGWGAAVLVVCAMLAAAGHGVGLRWDPLGLTDRKLRAAETRAVAAEAALELRRREAEAREAQQHRLDIHHRTTVSVSEAAARAAGHARNAHDASISLDSARLARLREHDRQLCDAAPSVCGPSEAASPAGRDDAVPARPTG